jgi:hypothetical protein
MYVYKANEEVFDAFLLVLSKGFLMSLTKV